VVSPKEQESNWKIKGFMHGTYGEII